MIQAPVYRYMGTNGIITSSIKLEGIYAVEYTRLTAAAGKVLVNLLDGRERNSVIVPPQEIKDWTERDK